MSTPEVEPKDVQEHYFMLPQFGGSNRKCKLRKYLSHIIEQI